MGVSENRGFSPQIIHFNRVFHYKPSILGYPCFWKHPYNRVILVNLVDQEARRTETERSNLTERQFFFNSGVHNPFIVGFLRGGVEGEGVTWEPLRILFGKIGGTLQHIREA